MTNANELRSAYIEGYRAARFGLILIDNPYSTEEYRGAWGLGFDDCLCDYACCPDQVALSV